MIDLRTLGTLDLRTREGAELRSVLTQPRRAALLFYLALARPRGFHRRDTLLALFWPEADTERARTALRQAVYFLRRSLGETTIVSRGDGELGLEPGVVSCDAVEFEALADAGEPERALALCQGDLLPGFFVEDAPAFERWLEEERKRLRGRAAEAAWTLAERGERAGDADAAGRWARRAVELTPADEAALRRLMELLARLEDRAGALRSYDEFARRLEQEYEVTPAAETSALAARLRKQARRRLPAATPASAPMARPPQPAALPVQRRRWWLPVAVALALVTLGGAVVLGRLHGRTPPGADPASVAVLPLEDLSPGHDQGYFADGVTEQLISLLGTVPGLRVPGRTSSFYFRDKRLPVQEIARQLGVRHVLEGSVRKLGRNVTLTVEFTDAATGRMLWSRPFQATSGDVVALQHELARSVVASLGFLLTAPAGAPRVPEAYDLYLQGLHSEQEGWKEEQHGLVRTLQLFRRALELDPGFAPARAALAHAYGRAGDWQHAKEAARQALAEDSTLVLARIALASSLAHGDWQWAEAEREADRAIALAPSFPNTYLLRSTIRLVLGRIDDALADVDRAEELDPYGSAEVVRLQTLVLARRYEEAVATFRRFQAGDTLYRMKIQLPHAVVAYVGTGRRVEAESLAHAWGLNDLAIWARGNRAEMLDSIRHGTPRMICDRYLAFLEPLGRTDALIDCLEELVNTRWRYVPDLLRSYSWDPAVAPNPRFQALLKRVGLPP